MGVRINAAGLSRDLELIDALGGPEATARGGLGVLRLAELTGRDKSQVSRALASLAAAGLVDRDPATQAYRPGWRLYALAAVTREAHLVRTAQPYLRQVVAQLRETAHLCVLRGRGVLTVATEPAPHAFRGLGWEGVIVPASQTSAGRVLISDWEPEALSEWFIDDTEAAGDRRQLRTAADLVAEIEAIRTNGYARVEEEFEEGLVGVSAPVRDHTGRITAAINVVAPKGRLGTRLEGAGRLTMRVATGLSEQLGMAPAGTGRGS
ncbi:IclR family transcriptional regulator [Micromonospora sp. WMMA1363]|uniref:IclR family transcriptional regulator n=1 Tax=Micromonospora sp. WMMA1363 TaxID=3053985 RepID=UPI00259D1DCB|nr:IclR family transcriptional regulator [Micromonospora sp. WMMA1363]MDM4718707.1 IclR family transcriptional regulator [Micromonospora sp. WMMA1363]